MSSLFVALPIGAAVLPRLDVTGVLDYEPRSWKRSYSQFLSELYLQLMITGLLGNYYSEIPLAISQHRNVI